MCGRSPTASASSRCSCRRSHCWGPSAARRPRRWAALGPLVATVFAAVGALGTWLAERTLDIPGGLCHLSAGPACFFAQDFLEQQARTDIEVLTWVLVGVTLALAFVMATLVAPHRKPAAAAQPPA